MTNINNIVRMILLLITTSLEQDIFPTINPKINDGIRKLMMSNQLHPIGNVIIGIAYGNMQIHIRNLVNFQF